MQERNGGYILEKNYPGIFKISTIPYFYIFCNKGKHLNLIKCLKKKYA
jgi:hypothetical protein